MTNKQVTVLLRAVVEHYDRMIAWVETQNRRRPVDGDAMFCQVSEMWGAEDCPLCQKFYLPGIGYCSGCPLKTCGGGSLWFQLYSARTWAGWLKYARLIRARAAYLAEEYGKLSGEYVFRPDL